MSLKVLYTGRDKKGTPIPDLIKMAHYNHPEVEFAPYKKGETGDVLLCINRTMKEDKSGIRKVMYLGSVPSFLKSKGVGNNSGVDHTFFISNYCEKIFIGMCEFENYSTFLPVGPMPADSNVNPILEKRVINGPIQFVSIAKWYKRPYKRLKHIVKLYRKHLRKEYPDSILHIIGFKKDKDEDGIYYHKKSFSRDGAVDIFKKCHIQLIPTAFDTGPKTIPESLHYRVPFVCSSNCAGSEYIDLLGHCGLEVYTDEHIDSYKKYKRLKPLYGRSKFVTKILPYDLYVNAVKEIVDNFEDYTSWEWNDRLNYKKQSDELYNMLKG